MHSRSLEPLPSSPVGLRLANVLSDGTVAAGPANSVLEGQSSRSTFTRYNCTREEVVLWDYHTFSRHGDPFRVWYVQMPLASVLFRQDATKIPAFADRLVLPHAARTTSFLITIVRLHIASMHCLGSIALVAI